ncbi:unnamed protein product [Closterium sp. Yama58-4]|nr:unnamed protein product [Closterium sp. Yama58-4]
MADQGSRVYYWDDYANDKDMRAMWAQPSVKLLWEQRREASGKVPFKMRRVSYLVLEEIQAVASILLRRHFSGRLAPVGMQGHEWELVCAVARVESSWEPLAYRFEPHKGEASTGLMQSTAKWLAEHMGYRAYTVDWASAMLYPPFQGMYYGMAYLALHGSRISRAYNALARSLSAPTHHPNSPSLPVPLPLPLPLHLPLPLPLPLPLHLPLSLISHRSEEFVVRAYNGGPGGADKPATAVYWRKYLKAKENLMSVAAICRLGKEAGAVRIIRLTGLVSVTY